ncbi:arsenical pump-driving ATPase [Geothrix paludis]|uniref:arsenical pump-driving ATPase n=1 Tax=Geothrix paludis TaxID=2922722 RepID=UPI001FAC37C1|nr:arsenical pump-driving ATPase [Geothrix paludis]
MALLVPHPTQLLFFTGKGGVGKTSAACSTAIALADAGKRVLLVSTDPASNLDEVLGTELSGEPQSVSGVPGLRALNIDPEETARAYREGIIAPVRGLLPEAVVASMEEQLSGACTTEIAAFDVFSRLLGDPARTADFDHILFDTAPTGHTLRLLELPAAWSTFIETNVGGNSCLGPLSGLSAQRGLYEAAQAALRDTGRTTLVLVARPDDASLREAERTRIELAHLGLRQVHLILNGLFRAMGSSDLIAAELQAREAQALDHLPEGLRELPRTTVPLLPYGLVGLGALRSMGGEKGSPRIEAAGEAVDPSRFDTLEALADRLVAQGKGVVMTMGKGGVGKTTLAARLALRLAGAGFPVTLTTTDPAAHVEAAAPVRPPTLRVTRIDPERVTERYRAEVLAAAAPDLDAPGRALLEEDLRSPCTEEIAVFRAFAETVAQGREGFVIIDTAPTGHTLLLLDAAEAYHREVLRQSSDAPEAVRQLLPRLRDAAFTRILLVTLPEATPIHEAMQLEGDLARAGIRPFAWVVNQSLTPLAVTDPVLKARRAQEARFLNELLRHTSSIVLEPLACVPADPVLSPGVHP